MTESEDNSINNKKANLTKEEKVFLYFRWLFFLLIITASFFSTKAGFRSFVFFETTATAIVYNILINIFIIKNKEEYKRKVTLIAYLDITLVCFFSYLTGGLESDFFIFIFFILFNYGMHKGSAKTLQLCVFSIIVYSAFILYSERYNLYEFSQWKLIIRDFFIVIAAHGVHIVNTEFKKHDEMHKKEFKLARTDKLTGLANRHYFEQKLKDELGYADFTGNPINFLIFDLDNFKKFNDSYGHIWGDKLLSLFSDIIMQNIRKSDIPVRYGGEEFLIIVRDMDLLTAKSIGERIRRQLEKQRIYVGRDDEKRRVTVSCGVAQFPKHSSNIREVIDLADKALYHAKEIGKNIVVAYDEIGKIQQSEQLDLDTYMGR